MNKFLTSVWSVARTSLGNALLLRCETQEKCLPIYMTNHQAYELLMALEKKENGSIAELFLSLPKKRCSTPVKLVLYELEDDLRAELYFKDRSSRPIAVYEGLLLSIRGELAIEIPQELFEKRSIQVNLLGKKEGRLLKNLEEKLAQAVEQEAYEEAAELRDKILEIEQSNQG